jgi:hypothetical protein
MTIGDGTAVLQSISQQDISAISELRELSAAMRHFSAVQDFVANAFICLAIIICGVLAWRWFGPENRG